MLKRTLKIAGFFCLFFFALLIALPTLLSTSWGKEQFLRMANRQIPGKISATNLELNWFGPQIANGVILRDPKGKPVLTAEKIETNASLFCLAGFCVSKTDIDVASLALSLKQDASGRTNFQNALGLDSFPLHPNSIPLEIALQEVFFHTEFTSSTEPVFAQIRGLTNQSAEAGKFQVELHLSRWDALVLETEKFLSHLESNDIRIKAEVIDFPTVVLDQLIAFKEPKFNGLATALFGEKLNFKLEQTKINKGMRFLFNTQTPRFQIDFVGVLDQNKLTLSRAAVASMQIHPELLPLLANLKELHPSLALMDPVEAALRIEHLELPLSFFDPAISSEQPLAMMATLRIGDAELIDIRSPEPIILKTAQMILRIPETSPSVFLQVQGEALQKGQPIELSAKFSAPKPDNYTQIVRDWKELSSQAALSPSLGKKRYTIDATVAMGSLTLPPISSIGHLVADNLQLSVQGDIGDILNCHLKTDLQIPDTYKLILGNKLRCETSAQLLFEINSETFKLPEFKAHFNSAQIDLVTAGKMDALGLELTAQTELNYILTPQISAWLGLAGDTFNLNGDSKIYLQINPFAIPFSQEPHPWKLDGKLVLNDLAFFFDKNEMSLKFCHLPWSLDTEKNRLKIEISGNTKLANKKTLGNINGAILLNNWWNNGTFEYNRAVVDADLQLARLPISLFSSFVDQDLTKLLGDTVDLQLQTTGTVLENKQKNLTVTIKGDNLEGSASLQIDDAITLRSKENPVKFQITLTNERFQALKQLINPTTDNLNLLAPTVASLSIASINWPINGGSLKDVAFHGKFTLDDLKLQSDKTPKVHFSELVATVETANFSQSANFTLTGEQISPLNGQKLPVAIGAKIDNCLDCNGELNLSNLALDLNAKAQKFPVILFCQLASLDQQFCNQLSALLGDTLNLDLQAKLQEMDGPIKISLDGTNGNILLDGKLDEGILTLNKPFDFNLKVTPQLGQTIFQDLIPILSGMKKSDHPIRMRIAPENFELPVHPLDLKKINANITIELGKIYFSNNGQLGIVLDLLQIAPHEELIVWSTPIYASMEAGTLRIERVDLLAMDKFPVAIWGKILTLKDKIDLTIGITGAALYQAFKIKGLEHDYMLQLPLKGKIGEASIDKTRATAKISALVAQKHGSAQGLLIGTVLDIASGGLTEPKVPEPTTNPIPWVDRMTTDIEKDTEDDRQGALIDTLQSVESATSTAIKTLFN